MWFREVIGQEQIKRHLLEQARSGHVPHAQLFHGPEGCGKFAMALAYAQYLLCSNQGEDESCGTCPECVLTRGLGHPDLHFIFPVVRKKKKTGDIFSEDYMSEWRKMVGQSPYFSIEEWLEQMNGGNSQPLINACESDALVRKLALAPSRGGRKVIVIWQAERMNPTAANKLLKILEEPTPGTVFLLIANDASLLLPTIVSRTQGIAFPPLGEDDIMRALQQDRGLSEADARHVAHYAQGNFIKALQSVEVNMEADIFFEAFVQLMRLSYQRKIKEMYDWSEQVAGWGREKQKNFLQFSQRLVRENFIYNFHQPELNFMSLKEANFSQRFARFINEKNVTDITKELELAQRDITQNVNAKMVFFDFALKMIVLLLK